VADRYLREYVPFVKGEPGKRRQRAPQGDRGDEDRERVEIPARGGNDRSRRRRS